MYLSVSVRNPSRINASATTPRNKTRGRDGAARARRWHHHRHSARHRISRRISFCSIIFTGASASGEFNKLISSSSVSLKELSIMKMWGKNQGIPNSSAGDLPTVSEFLLLGWSKNAKWKCFRVAEQLQLRERTCTTRNARNVNLSVDLSLISNPSIPPLTFWRAMCTNLQSFQFLRYCVERLKKDAGSVSTVMRKC